jgi:hypothetical protein
MLLTILPIFLSVCIGLPHVCDIPKYGYNAGYQAGLNDYNQHVNDTNHLFECPLAKIAPHSQYCFGYDRALSYMMSDQ